VSFLHSVSDDTPEWRPGTTPEACSVIQGLRALKVQSLDHEAFVFHHNGRRWGSVELHRAWRRVMAAAGVRYRAPEQLRHTLASTLLSRNAPLLYVQAQGGWRSAVVVYARWMPQDTGAAQTSPSVTQLSPAQAATTLK
jgi:integrase